MNIQRAGRFLAGAMAVIGATTGLAAQIPSHAVQLNPTAPLEDVRFAGNEQLLHVVGRTIGAFPDFIHYAHSVDGGRSWPLREVPIAYARALGDLVAEGEHVHVVVNAAYTGPHVMTSFDGGNHWLSPVRVSVQSNDSGVSQPRLHMAGLTVNVVWHESRSTGRIWANRSTDGGLTWQVNDTPLDAGLAVGPTTTLPLLVAMGAELHVFWGQAGSPGTTAYQRSLDGGATWLPVAPMLTNVFPLAAAGSGQVLVMSDSGGAHMLRSTDRGTTWMPITGHGVAQMLALAVRDSTVLLVGKLGSGLSGLVQLQVSTDAGASWLPVPYTVSSARSLSPLAWVTRDALFVHFAFPSDQYSPPGVVIQSDDLGVNWRQVAGQGGRGMLAFDDGALVLTKTGWNGTDVLAWVLEGHTDLGQGSPGTGGVVPTLAGRGLAGLGRTFSLETENARGGAIGACFCAFGPAVSVPLGAATLYLQQPIVTLAFATNGVAGLPGSGTASVPVAVPSSTDFAGLRLLSQAFVVDPAVADGFAATPAIETWIR